MKALTILPLVIAVALSACGEKNTATEAASAATVPAPVAAAAPAAPAASAADLVKGEKVYTATCLACHGAGVLGAPKFGDKAAWAPRIANGQEVMYKGALDGVRMMPPRGGNPALPDDDVKAAVDYMLAHAQ
jgi:cytochrome c5